MKCVYLKRVVYQWTLKATIRRDGPNQYTTTKNARYWSVMYTVYYQNGQYHRAEGPAVIEYRTDGSVSCEIYYQNGELHRAGGPAFIEYRADGSVYREG